MNSIQTHIDENSEMEIRTLKTLKKVRDRVKYILERYPSARGDDRVLLFRYYYVFEPYGARFKFKDFKQLFAMTSPETIRRRRQEWQERGEFLPTDRTIMKRRRREDIFREVFGSD